MPPLTAKYVGSNTTPHLWCLSHLGHMSEFDNEPMNEAYQQTIIISSTFKYSTVGRSVTCPQSGSHTIQDLKKNFNSSLLEVHLF